MDIYYVYILKSLVANFYYKGITNNVERRIKEHESGNNKFTKRYLPVELVHVEICKSRIEARFLEKFFKSGFGREVIKEIVDN